VSSVNAEAAGEGRFQVRVQAGEHTFVMDEPAEVGGLGSGPNPFDLLCAALAACTLMTMRLYAERKGWAIDRLNVRVSHTKGSADHRDRFDRVIEFGNATDEQREGLLKIAQRCPVDLLLQRGADVTVATADEIQGFSHADTLHAHEIEELCSEAP
jgi:putative redox protein